MPLTSQQTSQSLGQSTGTSQSGTQIIPGMLNVYNDLLGRNQSNYQNVLNSYTNGFNAVGQQLPGIASGYGQLFNNVRDTLGLSGGGWGVATPAAQAIQRTYAQNKGNIAQQMTSAGLGNTTVSPNLQNQATMQAGQAYGALGAQLAQTAAGYQAQLGQGQLAARMQGLGMQTGLAQAQGGSLAGYHFANTAGGLTGGYSNSQNTSTQTSTSRGTGGTPYGGAGGGSPTSGMSPSQLLGGSGIHNSGGTGPGVGYSGGLVPQGYYNPYTPGAQQPQQQNPGYDTPFGWGQGRGGAGEGGDFGNSGNDYFGDQGLLGGYEGGF